MIFAITSSFLVLSVLLFLLPIAPVSQTLLRPVLDPVLDAEPTACVGIDLPDFFRRLACAFVAVFPKLRILLIAADRHAADEHVPQDHKAEEHVPSAGHRSALRAVRVKSF
jgi:hypothetical protein